MQIDALLADRRDQLGDAFSLKEFHDDFMSRDRLPISRLRFKMTGLDDAVNRIWELTPVSRN
jgi:hypothetical protein